MPLSITLTDYGVGNLYSIRRSLENCGAEVTVVKDMKDVLDAETTGSGTFTPYAGPWRTAAPRSP